MNPAQIRRLARRLHEDRSRRIESLLVRLTADGTIPTYEERYRAERELADDLATVLSENFNAEGVYKWIEGTVCSDVVDVLARHKAAWVVPNGMGRKCGEETTAAEVAATHGLHKVLARNYVWCDKIGEIHGNTLNPYGYIDDGRQDYCKPDEHRAVFVQSDDPNEEF